MMNALIVDDEPLARERLRELLKPFADIEVIAEADSGAGAVIEIEKYEPDLLFLDVRLPGLDGFETLRLLETAPLPLVIFIKKRKPRRNEEHEELQKPEKIKFLFLSSCSLCPSW
jgi:chemotaxis response regulator CheB